MFWNRKSRWSLFTVVAVMVAACTVGDGPTAPAVLPSLTGTLGGLTGGLTATLLQCTPLPSQRVSQEVGPAGGTIRIGPHSLSIPRGALRTSVTITATIPGDPVNSVEFSPAGLRFATSARLTLSYANCLALPLPKTIVYATDALSILEILTSRDNVLAESVSAPVDHFSRYAVAW